MMLSPDANLNEEIPALQHGSHALQMEWQCLPTPNTPNSCRAEWKDHATCTHSWPGVMGFWKYHPSENQKWVCLPCILILNLLTDKLLILPLRKIQYKSPCYLNSYWCVNFMHCLCSFFCHSSSVHLGKYILGIAYWGRGNLNILSNAKWSTWK